MAENKGTQPKEDEEVETSETETETKDTEEVNKGTRGEQATA